MIIAQLGLKADGTLDHFKLSGHAGYAKSGSDPLCAGVSLLAETVSQTLEARYGVRVLGSAPVRGELQLRLLTADQDDKLEQARLLGISEVLVRGLRKLYQDFPGHISLEIVSID